MTFMTKETIQFLMNILTTIRVSPFEANSKTTWDFIIKAAAELEQEMIKLTSEEGDDNGGA